MRKLRPFAGIAIFTVIANIGVWLWTSGTLQLHAETAKPSVLVIRDAEQRKLVLDIRLKEKEHRLSEASAHAERLQAGVIFYLSVIVVGVITAVWRKDAPDWRQIRGKPASAFLVLLFLLANVNMAAQAMALSLNATANAKFVHVYLNPQISAAAGWPLERAPWSGKTPDKLHDALFWDQWWADQKQLFTAVRDEASGAWIAVVGVISFVALTLFEPRSVRWPLRLLLHISMLIVTVFAGWLTHAIFLYRKLGERFGARVVDAPTFHAETAATITLLIVVGWIVIGAARRYAHPAHDEGEFGAPR